MYVYSVYTCLHGPLSVCSLPDLYLSEITMLLSKECSLVSNRTPHRTLFGPQDLQKRLAKCCAAGNSRQQQQQQQRHTADQQPSFLAPDQQLRTAVVAAAVCVAFVSNVSAARASDNWIPRRHHRHIGERFTDTWADSIVEVRPGGDRLGHSKRQVKELRPFKTDFQSNSTAGRGRTPPPNV